MAIRKIREIGDSCLKKKCREVEKFDSKLHALLDDMQDTMLLANGVGLAAPQVGILRRVVVIDLGEEDGILELINPVITHTHFYHLLQIPSPSSPCLSPLSPGTGLGAPLCAPVTSYTYSCHCIYNIAL